MGAAVLKVCSKKRKKEKEINKKNAKQVNTLSFTMDIDQDNRHLFIFSDILKFEGKSTMLGNTQKRVTDCLR